MLAIHRGDAGWHTYYLRRRAHGAPLPRAADALADAAAYLLARLGVACGRPWRRLGALLRHRA